MEPAAALEVAKCLSLSRIEPAKDGGLLVVVDQIEHTTSPFWPPGAVIELSRLRRPEPQYVATRWEITFPRVVAYAVMDEMYHSINEDGKSTGRRLLTYSQSRFLEYMKVGASIHEAMPPLPIHYGVCMEDYCVNVLARGAPRIVAVDRCGGSGDENAT